MQTVLAFLLIFSVVVVIHEFGHFYFAKRAGILVREFAIGMGPKLFQHQAKDGTTYTIRLLPIGGYVRMAGAEEEDDLQPGMVVSLVTNEQGIVTKIYRQAPTNLINALPFEIATYDLVDALTLTGYINGDTTESVMYQVDHDATIIEKDGTKLRIAPRDVQFQSAKLWQRMLTNFAGPMNNFILAFFLFIVIVFARGGVPDSQSTMIGAVEQSGPAATAGLKAGDEIVSINGKKVANWSDISDTIHQYPKKEITVDVKRDGTTKSIAVTPKETKVGEQTIGQIGVTMTLKTGFFDKVVGGIQLGGQMFQQIMHALRNLITNFNVNQLGGPVAMFQMSSEAAQQGWLVILSLMAMISLNLGIFNLLPIPALDGGKLVLNMIEVVRGKPLSQEKEGMITLAGFALLMLLMIVVTWNDIQRFFF